MRGVDDWWRENAGQGRPSVLFAYAAGKAQHILAAVDDSIGPIACHGAVAAINLAYRESGVALPSWIHARELTAEALSRALVVAPPSAQGTPWLRRFGDASFAFASGWMTIRGMRKRRLVHRAFAISDHADWEGLNAAVTASGAERIGVTHGHAEPFSRWLRERGFDAIPIATEFMGEADDGAAPEDALEDAE
jgi:putative mRNA 3-end processing factor